MNIHEYQGKKLLKNFGITVPKGVVIKSIDDGIEFLKTATNPPWVLKAQIHSGGRAEVGGIKFAYNQKEFKNYLNELLGMQLITKQTGADGKIVSTVLVEEKFNILQEFYIAILIDRNNQNICFMFSDKGGSNVETLSTNDHESLKKISVDPFVGIDKKKFRSTLSKYDLSNLIIEDLLSIVENLYRAFFELDASLIEINPLALTEKNNLIALDSKWNFDVNGLRRQPSLIILRDEREEESLEIESAKHNLAYIQLEGTIGCMVNGAGLAMATMDIIKLKGGSPANFLDVGGGASVDKVAKAYEILVSNIRVKAVLVNIFGGIMRCDFVAFGLVEALRSNHRKLPLIARIKGFKEDQAKEILRKSASTVVLIDDLDEAASLAIEYAEVLP
ncbi:MAG: succinate--CoA ligase subunit beta [Betaproteobacteria bacterium TMED82]|nr:MAG: succinate--CoA ligase subunit beta [Betaproteobacteria bacterium TMED82]